MIKKLLFCTVLFTVTSAAAAADLLDRPGWRTVNGSFQKLNTGIKLTYSNSGKPFFFYNPGRELDIVPGKTYRVSAAYQSQVPLRIMLSMPGGKRSPYPAAIGNDGLAEVDFTARNDENKLRIHIQLPQSGTALLKNLSIREITPDLNLLKSRQRSWRISKIHGAAGNMKISGDTVTLTKDNNDGYIAFLAVPSDIPTVPGKNYAVSITFIPISGAPQSSIMVQMPHASRRPFPTVHAINGEFNLPETLEYTYTAGADEKLVRPHFILKGSGVVKLTGFSVRELSESEMQQRQNAKLVSKKSFSGAELSRFWQPHGARAVKRHSRGLEFIVSPTGGIKCDSLNWDAQSIKSLEIECSFNGEGGYLRCDFTSTDGKRTYSGYLGKSVIPDGKMQNLMFPVSEAPAWRGKITSVKFSFFGKSSPVAFATLNALPFCNRIRDIAPRGEYTLSRIFPASRRAAVLQILNSDYQLVKSIALPENSRSVRFTMPENAMLVRPVPADAPLLLTLNELKKLDLPPAFWRGKWIWCQNGFGPDASNVWFEKKFTLEQKPQEAAMVLSGDDYFELFINGTSVGKGRNWQTPGKFEISGLLKSGENRIVVKVHNIQAWGALIGELYALVNGKPQYFTTDASWRCHIGGDKEPEIFDLPAFVLGAPPLAPWGTRAFYRYIGPVGKAVVESTAKNQVRLKILAPPAVDTDRLNFIVRDDSGKERKIAARITPRTGKWEKGKTVNVSYQLANDRCSGKLYINEDFLQISGNAPAGILHGKSAPHTPMLKTSVINAGTRPYLQIGKERFSPFYTYPAAGFSTDPDSRWYQIRNTRYSGHKLTRFSFGFYDFWKDKGQFDYSHIDSLFDTVEMYAPGTKVIISIRCVMPEWWLKENPGHAVTYYSGAPRHLQKDKQALTSRKWIEDAGPVLRNVLRYLKNSPYADRIAGVAISEGWNSEWFHSYSDNNNRFAMSGYSQGDHDSFRAYLKEKYRTDDALAAAWQMPDVAINTAPMPSLKQIMSSQAGCLLDVKKEMQLIDWYIYRNRATGQALLDFCRIVKEESGGNWLAGAYYGYFLAFSNIFNRLQTVGHLAVEMTARSAYLDFVTAPSFYTWRFPGQGDAIMQFAECYSSHGKLVICEQDIRNFSETSAYEIRNGMSSTPETSIGTLERAFAMAFTRGTGTHWLDLYDNCFREKLILDELRKGKEAYESLPPAAGTTPVEICIVGDSTSAMYCKHNAGDGLATAAVGEMRRRFNEVAAPFRTVMMQDLLDKDILPPHKFYIITNLIMLPEADRARLMQRFEREKATVLWLYGAGLSTPVRGPETALMEKFLGLKFRRVDSPAQPAMNWQLNGKRGTAVNFNRTSPWFYPVAGFDKVYGRTDRNEPVLVSFERRGATHIFSTLMNLPPELVRELARNAGVRIYSESGDPVFVGNDVVAIHAKTGGNKKLFTAPGTELVPILGPEKSVKKSGESFAIIPGRTYIFYVRKIQK